MLEISCRGSNNIKIKILLIWIHTDMLTFAICDGLEASNLIFGMLLENCNSVDLFLVTERARRANLLIPKKGIYLINSLPTSERSYQNSPAEMF